MPCLGTACSEKPKNSFTALEGTFSLQVVAGFSKSFDPQHETCGEDKRSAVSSVSGCEDSRISSHFKIHMLLWSSPASSASTHVCARYTAELRHASLIGER